MTKTPTSRLLIQNRFSTSLIIPKSICKKLNLNPKDYVNCRVYKNRLIVEKVTEKPESW